MVYAKAAIEAMREPDQAMVDAFPFYPVMSKTPVADAYKMMIDAALKE